MLHFYMVEMREIRRPRADGKPGPLLGRFLPATPETPYSYRITPANTCHVEGWVKEGAARLGLPPGSASSVRISGKVA